MGEFSALKPMLIEAAEKMGLKEAQAAEKVGLKEAQVLEGTAKKEKGLFDKTMDVLSAPQRYVSKQLAKAAGLAPAATSEENFSNLVEKGATALGIPEDSTLGNAAKASAIAAAEVFGDPINMIPLGKVAKYANQSFKGLRELPMLARIAETGTKLKGEASIALAKAANKAKNLDILATKLKEPVQIISKESGQATETYKKLMAAKKAQEGAETIATKVPIEKTKLKVGNDMVEATKAMDAAIEQGVPPERQNQFVKLWLRARGIK